MAPRKGGRSNRSKKTRGRGTKRPISKRVSKHRPYKKPKSDDNDAPGASSDFKIRPETPNGSFKSLAGIDNIKEKIRKQLIEPFLMPKEFATAMKLKIQRGLLLYGPPGTGKTKMAAAIAHEIGLVQTLNNKGKPAPRPIKYYCLGASGPLGMWQGETERNIRTAFQTARANSPSVLFIDELDGLGRKRSDGRHETGGTCTIVHTLLEELSRTDPAEVVFIAATNYKERVDPALIRSGRMDVHIEMKMPEGPGRAAIFEHYLEKQGRKVSKPDLVKIVNMSEGWSGSKIETCVNKVHLRKLEQQFGGRLSATGKTLKEIEKSMKDNEILTFEGDLEPVMKDEGDSEDN